MGYTWTDGELITATKLNNTGGGGGYDFVITGTYNEGEFTSLTLESGSYSGIVSKIQGGDVVSGLFYFTYDGNTYIYVLVGYSYISNDSLVSCTFLGNIVGGSTPYFWYFLIDSNDDVVQD